MSRTLFVLLTFAATFTDIQHAVGEESSPTGIVKKKPSSGRFVEIENGFMIPYEVKIPGTDDSFWMEPIPPGTFIMGSPAEEKGRDDLEGPQVKVNVDPFWMGRHEVTQGIYRHYMSLYSPFRAYHFKKWTEVTDNNRIDAVTAPTVLYDPNHHFEFGEHQRMPIVTVTQYAAKQYTKWLSKITADEYRLPTEAEWEYACRAGTTTAWHFGNDASQLSEYAWFKGNSYDEGYRVVGQLKPNQWGLYDMHGNVAEWVHDHLEQYVTKSQPRNAATDWARKAKLDPKVVRGGSWEFPAEQCRSAARFGSDMDLWREYDPDLPKSPWWCTTDPARGVGLRVVRPLKRMTPAQRDEFWEPLDQGTKLDVADRISEGRGAIGIVSPTTDGGNRG